MFLCIFIQELCSKQENIKTDCSVNLDHQCSKNYSEATNDGNLSNYIAVAWFELDCLYTAQKIFDICMLIAYT